MKTTLHLFSKTLLTLLIAVTGAVAQPNLNQPASTTDVAAEFSVILSAYGGATSYDIELSQDGSFTGTHPDYQASIGGGRKLSVSDLTYGQTYQLRWRADNSDYTTTAITIRSSPDVYAKITNGATISGSGYNFYVKKDRFVTSYDWEFDTDLGFNSGSKVSVTTDASVSGGLYALDASNFTTGQIYFVRVRGNVASQALVGDYSTGADIKSFSVSSIAAPALQYPQSLINKGPKFTVAVGRVPGATSYDIELSVDGSFSGEYPDYQSSIGGGRKLSVTGLSPGTTYQLRWRSDNSDYDFAQVSTESPVGNQEVTLLYQGTEPFDGLQVSPGSEFFVQTIEEAETYGVEVLALLSGETFYSVQSGFPFVVVTEPFAYSGPAIIRGFAVTGTDTTFGQQYPVDYFGGGGAKQGTGANEEAEDVTVYPNPSVSSFNIVNSQALSVTVTDVAGNSVENFQHENGTTNFGTSLAPGVYIVHQIDGEGNASRTRIVKQ